jgi:hypothetical protein
MTRGWGPVPEPVRRRPPHWALGTRERCLSWCTRRRRSARTGSARNEPKDACARNSQPGHRRRRRGPWHREDSPMPNEPEARRNPNEPIRTNPSERTQPSGLPNEPGCGMPLAGGERDPRRPGASGVRIAKRTQAIGRSFQPGLARSPNPNEPSSMDSPGPSRSGLRLSTMAGQAIARTRSGLDGAGVLAHFGNVLMSQRSTR